MIGFLHTFHPQPILISFGPVNIYWYGLFMVLAILTAIYVTLKLTGYNNIKKEIIIDLVFWLIIFGLIGARIYHIFLESPYYLANPLAILKVWQGGLAIHGAIIGGLIAILYFAKKYKHNFWQITALIAPGLVLAQAIGRWGNYFNQELFGYPTDLPWGIPIDLTHRPWQYLNYEYFHPAFLYESIGNLLIFIILIYLYFNKRVTTRLPDGQGYELRVMSYLFLYSGLRFFTEFIRIDATPAIFGLRFPQLLSLLIILLSLGFFTYIIWRKINQNKALDN